MYGPAQQPAQQFRPAPQPEQYRPAPQPGQQSRYSPQPQQLGPSLNPAQNSSPQVGPGNLQVPAENYAHDSSGDNEMSRFQLYKQRKKQG